LEGLSSRFPKECPLEGFGLRDFLRNLGGLVEEMGPELRIPRFEAIE